MVRDTKRDSSFVVRNAAFAFWCFAADDAR